MRTTDLRIESVSVKFFDEKLVAPLRLSKGDISEVTYALVTLTAATRAGRTVQGAGAILLSDIWAFPSATLSHEQRDAAMRALCRAVVDWLPEDDWGDPLEKGSRLEEMLPLLRDRAACGATADHGPGEWPAVQAALQAMPPLAMLDCMAPFDAAIHDAWGHALDLSVYTAYTAANLNHDLSAYLGAAFAGRYPAEFLTPTRRVLAVQHVIGVGDRLAAEPGAGQTADGALPASLAGWIARDGVSAFKVKSAGRDPAEDARQLIEVYRVARAACPQQTEIHLSIDPNEGCEDPAFLLEFLSKVDRDEPRAIAALDYIEQPFPRGDATTKLDDADRARMQQIARWAPLIMDESLDSLAALASLGDNGWSGLAVKTCKGHTHSLLAYCWARHKGLYVTLQDLTNVGLALVHSANLCAHMALSVGYFECNQRQYIPHAQSHVRAQYAPYFAVSNGNIYLPQLAQPGLY